MDEFLDDIKNVYSFVDIQKNITEDMREDIKFYRDFILENNIKNVLELCCGYGRIIDGIKDLDININGIDISEEAFKKAKKTFENDDNIKMIKGDIRNFDLKQKFDLIIMPLNSMSHMLSYTDVKYFLKCTKKHMNKDSFFIIDLFLFHSNYLNNKNLTLLYSDNRIEVYENIDYDYVKQINNITWYIIENDKTEQLNFSLRVFSLNEMIYMFKYFKLKIIDTFGDYSKNSLNKESSNMIFILKDE